MKIPITKPYFDDEEKQLVWGALDRGWVVQGPNVAEFERKFAEFSGIDFGMATTSCTTALHLALIVLGIGAGDEVIVPAFSFVATANSVEYQSAKPVFVDINLQTFNMDISQLEEKITPRTRAIMPVALFGLSADMDPILQFAHRHNLKVIEDAACGIGAWYHGKHAGTMGDFGAVSFHPRKAITTGEGGMALTSNPEWAALARSLRDHGATASDLQRHSQQRSFLLPDYPRVGYNYRMTDVQGAMGVAQMGKLKYILERRRELARYYDQALADVPQLRTPHTPDGYLHGYQSYVCLFTPEKPTMENVDRLHEMRNKLMAALEDKGIATRQGTQAIHIQEFYRAKYGYQPADYPQTYIADRLTLTLPLYPQMTPEEQAYVVEHLKQELSRL